MRREAKSQIAAPHLRFRRESTVAFGETPRAPRDNEKSASTSADALSRCRPNEEDGERALPAPVTAAYC